MKKLFRSLLAVLLVAAIVGGYWYYRGRTAAAAETTSGQSYAQVVQVMEGALSTSVSVVGQLESLQSADLAFDHMSRTAKLATLTVQAGNTVTAGQVLATIDPAPYQQALDQATSDLAAAEKTLADLKANATDLEMAQADLAVTKAKYQLQKAQDTLDDLVNPDIATLELAVVEAQSTLASAQADLLSLQQEQSYQDQLARLINAETALTETYNRLAAETYRDDYYQDRLELAYNKMRSAQDARVTFELNRQISILQAQMQLRKTQKTLADAQDASAEALAGGDQVALAQAQVAVNEAQVALQSSQQARTELLAGAAATKIAAAQADVDKKRLVLNEAQAALDGATLVAPFDGTVLSTNVKAGGQVAANTTILTIANLKSLQVVASIDETTIKQISAGQAAVMTFDAFAGQTFTGTVQSVPLQGTLQGGVMVYDVPISLNGTDKLTLLVGMTANVKIVGGQTATTLLVPTVALQKANGLYQVLVPDSSNPGGDPVAVPVEVGLSDGAYTQILKGLNAGDKIVYEVAATTTTNTDRMAGGPGGMMLDGGGAPPAPPSGQPRQ